MRKNAKATKGRTGFQGEDGRRSDYCVQETPEKSKQKIVEANAHVMIQCDYKCK